MTSPDPALALRALDSYSLVARLSHYRAAAAQPGPTPHADEMLVLAEAEWHRRCDAEQDDALHARFSPGTN